MKTANLEDDGANAGGIVRGHRAPKRATSGMPLVTDATGTEVLANRIHFADLTVSDDDENTAIISGAAASSVEVWAQQGGGLTGDGVTDDTDALQDLIDDCTLDGTRSCTIRFEPGTYLIGGALQDTSAFNGQIVLPEVESPDQLITLSFVGPARPAWGGTPLQDPGSAIIRSTLTGGTGTAAVISGGNGIVNRLSVVVKDLVCVAPTNPTFTFWNLSCTYEGKRDGLQIVTNGVAEPTNSNAYGIKLPKKDIGSISVENIWVLGFYTGVQAAELTYGDINVWLCIRGLELAESSHLSGPFRLEVLSCPYGIYPTGNTFCDITYDSEHRNGTTGGASNPAWAALVADLYDPNNYLHGHVRWWGVSSGVGPDHVFTVNGGGNAHYEEIGQPAGSELAYTAITADVTITGTTEGGATTVVTSGSVISSGSQDIMVEFFTPNLQFLPATATNSLTLDLYEDSTIKGRIERMVNPSTSSTMQRNAGGRLRLTPSAGSHTYTVKGWRTNSGDAAVVKAGAGGAGAFLPTFIRVTRA